MTPLPYRDRYVTPNENVLSIKSDPTWTRLARCETITRVKCVAARFRKTELKFRRTKLKRPPLKKRLLDRCIKYLHPFTRCITRTRILIEKAVDKYSN